MEEAKSETLKYLENVKIFNLQKSNKTGEFVIPYLSFTETGEIPKRTGESESNVKTLALILRNEKGSLDRVILKEDELIEYKIVDHAVDLLIEQAFKNSQQNLKDLSDRVKLKLIHIDTVYDKHIESVKESNAKLMIGKIMSLSNFIASNSRRGPANYVILPESLYSVIEYVTNNIYKGLYAPSDSLSNFTGINILCSNKLKDNQFIVGRKGTGNDPGLHLVTSERHINSYVLNKKNEAVPSPEYKLVLIEPETFVFGCEVKWNNEKE